MCKTPDNKTIIVAGAYSKEVEQFILSKQQWITLPKLSISGCLDRSCFAIADKIYVFYGWSTTTERKSQIESLKFGQDRWQLIEVPGFIIYEDEILSTISIDGNEIILLGITSTNIKVRLGGLNNEIKLFSFDTTTNNISDY